MKKSTFLFTTIFGLFCILIFRIFMLHNDQSSKYQVKTHKIRQEILDCNREILAFTQVTNSIYAIPNNLTKESVDCIKNNFNINIENLQNSTKSFAWIKRHISDEEIEIIKKNKTKGIVLGKDFQRIYSHPRTTAHIIGYCDRNMYGKSGAELAFENELYLNPIQLTIDSRIQNILHNIIEEICTEFDSEDASGIIVDVESGEVRAMVSFPSPNSDFPQTFMQKENKNHNLSAIEVGSILKLQNAAMCLENRIVNLDTVVDATGTLQIGKYEITDFFGKNSKMTFLESVRFSSNIATGRLALEVGAEKQKEFFRKIGFLSKIEWLPNHFASPLRPKRWGKSTTATLSYGYGIGLTSLHVTQSLMRILTGTSRNLSFYYPNNQTEETSIISEHTIESVKLIMRQIIKSAYRSINIEGYEIGGKTGTANICENGAYIEGKNRVSYLGAFPIHKPKYVFLIQSTNPKKSRLKYGRFTVAANVLTQKVKYAVQEIASIENVAPVS